MSGILRYMLRFRPIKAVLSLFVILMLIVCLEYKLIKGYSSWAQMALTPVIFDETLEVVTSKIKDTDALEFT